MQQFDKFTFSRPIEKREVEVIAEERERDALFKHLTKEILE